MKGGTSLNDDRPINFPAIFNLRADPAAVAVLKRHRVNISELCRKAMQRKVAELRRRKESKR